MCEIAVAIDWDDAEATVGFLIEGLSHRGDITDPVVSPIGRTAFATRRLRIVDGAHNRQPALSWDGCMLVAFNGEIYNYRALRAEMAALGAFDLGFSAFASLPRCGVCWATKPIAVKAGEPGGAGQAHVAV